MTERKRSVVSEAAAQVEEEVAQDIPELLPLSTEYMLSTGCTLLDLAISGKRVRGGGIPGGAIVEVFGAHGCGKTAVLVEAAADAIAQGGNCAFADPEARLDKAYAEQYGMHLKKDLYTRPDTVEELFDWLQTLPYNENAINVACADSLAALSTNLEMDGEDKMGMRRAKMFSERLRKNARVLGQHNRVLLCSNQMRQGDMTMVTPGGKAVGYYSSIRVQLRQLQVLTKKKKYNGEHGAGKELEKAYGIKVEFVVKKNSVDDPYRKGTFYLIFNYGIDNIRSNLQYIKDVTKSSTYLAVDKSYQSMQAAVDYIEKNNLEDALTEMTINLFNEVEDMFRQDRKPKQRGIGASDENVSD